MDKKKTQEKMAILITITISTVTTESYKTLNMFYSRVLPA